MKILNFEYRWIPFMDQASDDWEPSPISPPECGDLGRGHRLWRRRMRNLVYVIHEPVRYDKTKEIMVPINLKSADKFGERFVVFPGMDRPPPLVECASQLKTAMARFTPSDRLLIAGDMDLVIFAAILAAKACNGALTLLKWHSRDRCYQEVTATEDLFS